MKRYWEMTEDERIEDSDRIAVMNLQKKLTKKAKRTRSKLKLKPSAWEFIKGIMKKDWWREK